jgi:subtilisin family serine protease
MSLVAPSDSNPEPILAGTSTKAWGLSAVGADVSKFDGSSVTVAVLDTGIDPHHPAFANVTLIHKNFTHESDGDSNGHGTHCAGTFFGGEVNGTRIGVAPGISAALIGKVLNERGAGESDAVANAVLWATDQGALVVLMSLGIDFPGYVDQLVKKRNLPLKSATSRGLDGFQKTLQLFSRLAETIRIRAPKAALIAAAGNESMRQKTAVYRISVTSPATTPGIVSVGALAQVEGGLEIARFSNTGSTVVAPGVNIVSAAYGTKDLVSKDGTSMAAPHVAGVAALWAQMFRANNRLNDGQLAAVLTGHARLDMLKPGFFALDMGAGLVRAP